MFTREELTELTAMVRRCALQELLPRFTHVQHTFKQDGSLITAADLATQQALQALLHARWPQLPMLGEEMTTEVQQQLLHSNAAGVWIVDPLDGTMNFSNGLPGFSVSVALLADQQLIAGVVYDPVRDECFSALHGAGAWLNGEKLDLSAKPQPKSPLIGIVDFKRLSTELAQRLATQPPYSSQRSFGSVALDWSWLAAGRAQVYIHGKQNLWDYAAGLLIFTESQGYSCTLQGEAVFDQTLTPRSAIAAVSAELFAQWRTYLGVN